MRSTSANRNRPARPIVRCEIVRVASPEFLIDPYQRACRYETADGTPLELGYYLVLWPAGANGGHYGHALRYIGPLPTLAAARLLKTSAVSLGLIAQPMSRDAPPLSGAAPSVGGALRPYPPPALGHPCAAG